MILNKQLTCKSKLVLNKPKQVSHTGGDRHDQPLAGRFACPMDVAYAKQEPLRRLSNGFCKKTPISSHLHYSECKCLMIRAITIIFII